MSPATAAPGPSSRPQPALRSLDYFVVMIDYGRRGREAIVDPEITRREVIARLVSREYDNVLFIHHVMAGAIPQDVTLELQLAASALAMEEAA